MAQPEKKLNFNTEIDEANAVNNKVNELVMVALDKKRTEIEMAVTIAFITKKLTNEDI